MAYSFIDLVNILDVKTSVKLKVQFGGEEQTHEVFRVIGDPEVNYKLKLDGKMKYFRSLYETLIALGLNPYTNVGPITIVDTQEGAASIPPKFNYIQTKEKPVEKFIVEETDKPTATETLMSIMKSIIDNGQ